MPAIPVLFPYNPRVNKWNLSRCSSSTCGGFPSTDSTKVKVARLPIFPRSIHLGCPYVWSKPSFRVLRVWKRTVPERQTGVGSWVRSGDVCWPYKVSKIDGQASYSYFIDTNLSATKLHQQINFIKVQVMQEFVCRVASSGSSSVTKQKFLNFMSKLSMTIYQRHLVNKENNIPNNFQLFLVNLLKSNKSFLPWCSVHIYLKMQPASPPCLSIQPFGKAPPWVRSPVAMACHTRTDLAAETHLTIHNTPLKIALQGINISYLGKRKIIFKMPFLGDMLVPWRVTFWTQKSKVWFKWFFSIANRLFFNSMLIFQGAMFG